MLTFRWLIILVLFVVVLVVLILGLLLLDHIIIRSDIDTAFLNFRVVLSMVRAWSLVFLFSGRLTLRSVVDLGQLATAFLQVGDVSIFFSFHNCSRWSGLVV